jgi:primase-polymerase (primpol)-like protein
MFLKENIPIELKNKNQWVCYRTKQGDGHVNKYMLNPFTGNFAKSNDPHTWSSYYYASYQMKNPNLHIDGLAYVLSHGLVFIDIDHSIDEEGNFNDTARKLLDALPNTYAEKSCSGHGVHILAYGSLPIDGRKRNDEIGLEMYDTKRFCCITGDVIDGRKEILDYSDKIAEINEEFIGKRISIVQNRVFVTPSMSDQQIILRISESKSGPKFNALYRGDINGYPSHSNADFALARMIAFWTQDPKQIDAIIRSSGLYRDKWDKSIGDTTYGELTIQNALKLQREVYSRRGQEME